MRYIIVEGKVYCHYAGAFHDAVQRMIDRGWSPLGGLAFDPNNNRLFQAMTRDKPEEEEDWRLAP